MATLEDRVKELEAAQAETDQDLDEIQESLDAVILRLAAVEDRLTALESGIIVPEEAETRSLSKKAENWLESRKHTPYWFSDSDAETELYSQSTNNPK